MPADLRIRALVNNQERAKEHFVRQAAEVAKLKSEFGEILYAAGRRADEFRELAGRWHTLEIAMREEEVCASDARARACDYEDELERRREGGFQKRDLVALILGAFLGHLVWGPLDRLLAPLFAG